MVVQIQLAIYPYLLKGATNLMKRNLSIDIMRVIGAIAVASCHSTYLTNPRSIPLIFPSGYIAVEFFFILTGYFMVEHSMKVKSSDIGEGSILFITKKIASILSVCMDYVSYHYSFT